MGTCFTEACRAAQDREFLALTVTPFALAAAYAVKKFRDPPNVKYLDPDAGSPLYLDPALKEEGTGPEYDAKGKVAYTVDSYTPWPVTKGAPGERVRVEVGPVNNRVKRTYVFEKSHPKAQIVLVTLSRPMGVVFEERGEGAQARVVVAELVPGSAAERLFKMAKMNRALEEQAVLPGDVLRAVTAVTLVYPAQSLAGVSAPKRTVVLYGADSQSWPKVAAALKRGTVADGEVTLVLERPAPALEPAAPPS